MTIKSFAFGESCSNPNLVTPSENFGTQNYFVINSDKSIWFSFVANSVSLQIHTGENASVSPYTHSMQIEVFSGNCTSLSLIQSLGFETTPQGERSLITENLVIGQTYYIKIITKSTQANLACTFLKLAGSSSSVCALPNSIFLGNASGGTTLSLVTNAATMGGTYNGVDWTFVNKNYMVFPNTTLVIDHKSKFSNCNFIFSAGCKIIYGTAPNLTTGILNLDKCYLGGCQNMWVGIQIYNIQDLLQITNSIIEDAAIAVDIKNRSHFTLTIESTVFNKNLKSISILNSNVLFNLKNNVFTSRNLYSSIPSSLPAVAALKPSTSSINSPLYYNSNNSTALKAPNTNVKRSVFGIQLVNTNNSTSYENQIIGVPTSGASQFNLFDYQDYGIDARQSRVKIQNNVFVAGDGTINPNFTMPYSSTGVGIVANGTATINQYKISVGGLSVSSANFQPNYFWVQPNPAILYNFSFIDFTNNTVSTGGALLISPSSGSLLNPGIVNCNYNKNYSSGSYSDFRINLSNTLNSTIFINNNNLGIVGSSSYNKILIQNSISGSNNTISVSNNFLNSYGNIHLISIGASNGITTQVSGNFISMARFASPLPPYSINYGIRLQGVEKANMYSNTLIGNITSSFHYNPFVYGLRGITLEQSTECTVNCNYVSQVDQALVFNGTCLNTTGAKEVVFTNELRNCYQGLVLENSGNIGQQGALTSPSDNLWTTTGGWVWNAQAHAQNSVGSNSPLFIRNAAGYIPTPNTTIFGNPFLLISASGSRPFCAPCVGPGCLPPAALIATLEDLIHNDLENEQITAENEWINKKYALEKLLYDPTYATSNDSMLNAFADSASNANLGAILESEQSQNIQDYVNAKLKNDNLNPENQIEINLKIYRGIYFEWQLDSEFIFTESHVQDLRYIAYQCYETGGETVLQARALLEYLFANNSPYPENCVVSATTERSAKQLEKQSTIFKNYQEDNIKPSLSPNPATDSFSILTDRPADIFEIKFYNALGELELFKKNVPANININTTELASGMYFYRLRAISGKIFTGKIVVNSEK